MHLSSSKTFAPSRVCSLTHWSTGERRKKGSWPHMRYFIFCYWTDRDGIQQFLTCSSIIENFIGSTARPTNLRIYKAVYQGATLHHYMLGNLSSPAITYLFFSSTGYLFPWVVNSKNIGSSAPPPTSNFGFHCLPNNIHLYRQFPLVRIAGTCITNLVVPFLISKNKQYMPAKLLLKVMVTRTSYKKWGHSWNAHYIANTTIHWQ